MNASFTDRAAPATPRLSVVIASFNSPPVLARCLAALCADARGTDVEMLLVRDCHGERAAVSEQIRFPGVRWIEAERGCTVPRLRSLGIAGARGTIVALIEDDCVVDPGWCEAVIAAHLTPDIAIGGAVEPGSYVRAIDWAVYFCDYARFMLPLAGGPHTPLPGNNVAYKRAAFDAAGRSGSGLYEVFVHAALERAGHLTRADDTLVVRIENFWALRHVTSVPYHHGRAYAGQRLAGRGMAARIAFALATPVLPAVKIGRILRETLSRRRLRLRFLEALPWTFVFMTCWSCGEAVGALFGAGESPAKWR